MASDRVPGFDLQELRLRRLMDGQFDEAGVAWTAATASTGGTFPPFGTQAVQVLRHQLKVAGSDRNSKRRTHDAYSDWLCSRMNCGR